MICGPATPETSLTPSSASSAGSPWRPAAPAAGRPRSRALDSAASAVRSCRIHVNEAETWLDKALDADARDRTHWGTAQDYLVYSELHNKRGDLPRARECLGKAIEKFAECGADGWVTRTEERLGQVQ